MHRGRGPRAPAPSLPLSPLQPSLPLVPQPWVWVVVVVARAVTAATPRSLCPPRGLGPASAAGTQPVCRTCFTPWGAASSPCPPRVSPRGLSWRLCRPMQRKAVRPPWLPPPPFQSLETSPRLWSVQAHPPRSPRSLRLPDPSLPFNSSRASPRAGAPTLEPFQPSLLPWVPSPARPFAWPCCIGCSVRLSRTSGRTRFKQRVRQSHQRQPLPPPPQLGQPPPLAQARRRRQTATRTPQQ